MSLITKQKFALIGVVLVLIATTVLVTPAPGSAAAPGSSYTVSTGPLPLPARSGDEIKANITISNQAKNQATFDLTIVPVEARNEGVIVQSGNPPTPIVKGTSIASKVTVSATTSQKVAVNVAVPAGLAPDIYLVGILIVPEQNTQPGVVTNQLRVLEHVAVSVVGATSRGVDATQKLTPSLLIGGHANGRFTVKNTGGAGVVVTRLALVGGNGRSHEAVTELTGANQEVVLAGLEKTYTYKWKPGSFMIGHATPYIELTYDDDGVTAVRHFTGPRILVVTPMGVVLLAGTALIVVALAVLGLIVIKKRKKKVPEQVL